MKSALKVLIPYCIMDDSNEVDTNKLDQLPKSLSIKYKKVKRLQTSLFGETQLLENNETNNLAVVKISIYSNTCNNYLVSTNNKTVYEDTRREVKILQYLQKNITIDAINETTCGLSSKPSKEELEKYIKPCLKIYEEYDDENNKCHYIITQYAGQDLFTFVATSENKKLELDKAKVLLYEICKQIYNLHARSIAHMDISLENICIDSNGNINLIDYGLATIHPDHTDNQFVASHIKLSTTKYDKDFSNYAGFICEPFANNNIIPGKRGYICREIIAGNNFNPYKSDIYSIGLILYTMLTGYPPFNSPTQHDPWFKVIYTGKWLSPDIFNQPNACVYNTIDKNALKFINKLIKPQHMLPTIDQLLNDPFFESLN
jgi:serine/threonine protein kinase